MQEGCDEDLGPASGTNMAIEAWLLGRPARDTLVLLPLRGRLATGHLAAGHLADGHLTTGHLAAGYLATGHLAAGYLATGHLAAGHLATGYLATRHFRAALNTSLVY